MPTALAVAWRVLRRELMGASEPRVWAIAASVLVMLAAATADARPKPRYFVTVVQTKATPTKGAAQSPFRADVRLGIARDELTRALQDDPSLTSNAKEAKRLRLAAWSLDVGITHFEQRYNGDQIELEAEIKVSVSNERGRIVSVLSKTVTLPVRRCDYHPTLMRQFVRDLVMGATDSVAGELVDHLQQQVARR